MKKRLPMSCLAVIISLVLCAVAIAIPLLIVNGQKYKYPDGMTGEYFYSTYTPMEYNYAFSTIYGNAADNGNPYRHNGRSYRFYALCDVSIDDYAVGIAKAMGSGTNYVLYAAEGRETDLIGNYGIEKISIILRDNTYDEEKNIVYYGKGTSAKQLDSVENKSICESIKKSICDREMYVKKDKTLSNGIDHGKRIYCMEDEYLNTQLYVRIYFTLTDNIFWESNVILFEERYFLASYRNDGRSSYDLIPLSDEVSDYLKEIVSESGYSFAYEYKHAE
ncbi:MAG: hypothetical protein E7611_02720 [Ruminococcaceae bacterium]|nr:hypothetical protein [Oscillospiraceae bacterium]